MSSQYITEPPTNGKILLHTTVGDIEIELWSKEAPLAVRNFIQLSLEGYYNGTIFHRIIPGFIAQGGDPTGTGTGGESVYRGGTFKDEFHSRLRFTRRGIVAMANENNVDQNRSQFFITLAPAEHLNQKHTIFGKVVGDTIFNVLKMGEMEVDKEDRPLFPPKIKSVKVLHNPFDNIVPRKTKEVKVEDEKTRPDSQKRKGIKNMSLLSFEEESGAEVAQLKLKSAHDLLKTDPKLSQSVKKDDDKGAKDVQVHGLQKELTETSEMLKQKKAETEILSKSNIVERNNEQQQSEIARLEQEIREMKRKPRDVTDKKSIKRQKESLLEQETSRFLKKASVASRAMSEDETLARLQSFQQRIRGSTGDNRDKSQAAHVCSVHNIPNCGSCAVDNTLPTSKATERGNWTDNWLQFPKDLTGKDLLDPNSRRVDNADDLVVVDPRKRRQ